MSKPECACDLESRLAGAAVPGSRYVARPSLRRQWLYLNELDKTVVRLVPEVEFRQLCRPCATERRRVLNVLASTSVAHSPPGPDSRHA